MSHEDLVDDLEAGANGPLDIPHWHEFLIPCIRWGGLEDNWVELCLCENPVIQWTQARIDAYRSQLKQSRRDLLSGRGRRVVAMIVALGNIVIAAINVDAEKSEGLQWALASSIISTCCVFVFPRGM